MGGTVKSLALRPAMPDIGAVLRSLLGVLLVAGAALIWAGSSAAIAGAGAAAIAGAVALQDSPRGQFRLVCAVSLAMAVAVLLAGTLGPYAVPFAFLVAGWGFVSGMAWALGANAGLVAAAAMALLVVTPPAEPPWPAAPSAAGLALCGGLAQAVLIAIWPRRRWQVQRAALARAYGALAADARAIAVDPTAHVDPEPLVWLREAFTLTEAQAHRRPLAYRAWYGLPERLAATLSGFATGPGGDELRERILLAAADVLDAVALANPAGRSAAEYALGRLDATIGAPAAQPNSALATRLSQQLHEAVRLRFGEWTPGVVLAELRRPGRSAAVRAVAATVTAELNWDSTVLRHAIRLAAAASTGALVARLVELDHAYWIPLTVVMVLRPETAHTYTRCAGRIAGNALGIVVASSLVVLVHPSGLLAAALAVAFLGIGYAVSNVGYLALSAALAAAIVFLLDIGGSSDAATVGDRMFATLIGGILAVLAHVILPDHALVRLRQRAGELLKTEIDYAGTVVRAFVHELDKPAAALAASWERAYRARAAFEAAAGANPADDRDFRRWLRAYRTSLNVVTASCSALEAARPAHPPRGWSPEFITSIDEYVDALCGDPATPGAEWRPDVILLGAATDRVRAALPPADAPLARMLVGELGTITEQLATISAGPRA